MAGEKDQSKIQFDELTKIEALRAQMNVWVDQVVTKKIPPVPIPELESLIKENWQWRERFWAFAPAGQDLLAAGLPELTKRLSEQLSDIDGAIKVYGEMIEERQKHDRLIAGIQHKTDVYVSDILEKVRKGKVDAMAKSREAWSQLGKGDVD
jgi:hypothetical protein